METIKLDSPFNMENFIHSNRVFWHYIWNKRKKQLIRWLGISLFFVGLGIFVGISDETRNPFIFIGIFLFCLLILSTIEMFFSWRKQTKRIQEMAEEYKKADSEYIIEITEESINIRDFQSAITLKWSAFKYYTIYKDHIILIPKNYIAGGLIINKENDGPEKYDQTLELLENKLNYIAP